MLLLALAIIAVFLALTIARRLMFLCFAVALALVIGQSTITDWALSSLQTDSRVNLPEWKSRNAIVLLGAGAMRSPVDQIAGLNIFGITRASEAARLYHDCRRAKDVCRIIASGGDPSEVGHSEAELMATQIKSLRVPADDIVLEDKSQNTFQNARFCRPLLGNYDKIYLVTSGIHLKRAQLYFHHFGIRTLAAPADFLVATGSIWPSATNFYLFDLYLHEQIGIWRFQVYNLLGWNTPPIVEGHI